MLKLAIACVLVGLCLDEVLGHGMMMEPPGRGSMWRVGFDTPKNYNDMEANCGGFTTQWDQNDGKCGLCGDNYNGPRDHEAGGKWAPTQWDQNDGKCGLCGDNYNGPRDHEAGGKWAPVNRPIARCYNKDQATIPINIRMWAYHKGYFEFYLCKNDDLSQDPGEECYDPKNKLTIAGMNGETKYDINNVQQEYYEFSLVMPEIECSQCILRWWWNTGNRWGCEGEGYTNCGIGLANQEQFINCADVAILDDCEGISTVAPPTTMKPPYTDAPATNGPIVTNAPATNPPATNPPATNPPATNPPATNPPATNAPTQNPGTGDVMCKANQVYKDIQGMNEWCKDICRAPLHLFCPQSHCICYDTYY